ncbi:alpha-galactosidase [Lacticaseibacillus zeae]|uniref:Alpha-galactosidase n=1 Tax=Lacticaseibacillus zeae TaxID=57037 RepID=A0A5R8LH73_LACZE|nr:alpha-galactosidase [Lacticaseibacillus zeae]
MFVDSPDTGAKTRSLAQKSVCKDDGRNGQTRAITPKATYAPVSNRGCSRSLVLKSSDFIS